MNAKTIHVELTAVDTQGSTLLNRTVTADTILRDRKIETGNTVFSVIDLRLAVPVNMTDDVLQALRLGKVEIAIDSVNPAWVEQKAAA
jgi:hypothetical protein